MPRITLPDGSVREFGQPVTAYEVAANIGAGLAKAAAIAVRPIDAEHPAREIVVAWRAGSNRRAEGRLLADVLKEV